MNILDETIQELYEIEPYWSICNPCKCKGYCCVGAEVGIYEDEWEIISDFIRKLPREDKAHIIDNIKNKRNCIFRTDEKCLIHPVRPENCRYTPYQYVISDDNYIRYSQVKLSDSEDKCRFKMIYVPIDPDLAQELKLNKFSDLSNFDRYTKYLSLNWQVAHSENRGEYHTASAWIHIKSSTR